jgi:hypothetical protein
MGSSTNFCVAVGYAHPTFVFTLFTLHASLFNHLSLQKRLVTHNILNVKTDCLKMGFQHDCQTPCIGFCQAPKRFGIAAGGIGANIPHARPSAVWGLGAAPLARPCLSARLGAAAVWHGKSHRCESGCVCPRHQTVCAGCGEFSWLTRHFPFSSPWLHRLDWR